MAWNQRSQVLGAWTAALMRVDAKRFCLSKTDLLSISSALHIAPGITIDCVVNALIGEMRTVTFILGLWCAILSTLFACSKDAQITDNVFGLIIVMLKLLQSQTLTTKIWSYHVQSFLAGLWHRCNPQVSVLVSSAVFIDAVTWLWVTQTALQRIALQRAAQGKVTQH